MPAGADAAPGTLDLRQSLDRSHGLYVEGSFSYVRVRGVRGKLVVAKRVNRARFRMQRRLAPGRYKVISYQRPCDGNCGTLDPPTDRCARHVHVLSGGLTEVAVRVRPGRRCRMSRRALPARYPPVGRLRAVQRWLSSRGGINSWALVDSWGRMHRFAPGRVYVSASLVKAMLLVAYLRGIGNRAPDAGERASLDPMIKVSSNDAADTVYYRVGDAALYRLARLAGMRNFSVAGYWANAHFSAEDQARFFNRIDRLVPKASRGYARGLLSSIVSYQRWGFSRYSLAAGFKTFFKGGWRGTGAGQLVHEAALFERGRTRVSMAVLTDGNPSQAYGQETLRGVAQRVFHRARASQETPENDAPKEGGSPATRRAGLVDVLRFGPSILVNLSYRTKHNETGAPLPGYCENWALMHERAAFSLGQVQRYVRRRGHGLLVLDAYRPRAGDRGTGPLGRADGPWRRGGHLHRAAKPPQHGQRPGHHAGPLPRRQAPAHGRLRLRPQLAHLQRERTHPPQQAHAEERHGALRLQRLPERVVALRALLRRYLDVRSAVEPGPGEAICYIRDPHLTCGRA